MNPKLKFLLTSRKFWALIVGLVLTLAKTFWPTFPITEDQLVPIVALLVTFILGVAVEDAGRSIGTGLSQPGPPPADSGQSYPDHSLG